MFGFGEGARRGVDCRTSDPRDPTHPRAMDGAPARAAPGVLPRLPARLEQENINAQVPWLYGFKLEFRFR